MLKDIIKLDLHKQDTYPVIYAKQYDNLERQIIIELYDNNVAYSLEGTVGEDYTVNLRYTKPDGKQGFLEYTIEDNVVSVYMTDQMLAKDGRVVCDVAIYRNKTVDGTETNTLLSSCVFYVNVGKSAYNEEKVISSNEFLALTKATNECIKVTTECQKLVSEYTSKIKPEMLSLIEQMKELINP